MAIYPHVLTVVMTSPSPVVYTYRGAEFYISLTAVAEMAVNPGDWYGEIWDEPGFIFETDGPWQDT
jgi:hypothetical protein